VREGCAILLVLAVLAAPLEVRAADSGTATELNNQAIVEGRAGRFEQAVSLLRKALLLNPSDALIRKNLSYALTDLAGVKYQREGNATQAFQLLREAVDYFPQNGPAWVHLGDVYYLERNDFGQAVEAWKKAHGFVPETQWAGIAGRITQAERDASVERRFAAEATTHFQIRFDGPEQRQVVVRVGQRLEEEYQRLAEDLGDIPTSMTVILYPPGSFEKVNAKMDWAIGFYDGRIRVRMEEIGTPWEERVLAHELTHAFLHQLFGNGIPTWVHEGYAQVREPKRPFSEQERRIMDGISSRSLWVPLKWLDSHFEQPSDMEDVLRAYAQARMVVEFLNSTYGTQRFKQFLKRLASGELLESAFDASFAPSRWVRFDQGTLE